MGVVANSYLEGEYIKYVTPLKNYYQLWFENMTYIL
jgi:hypothetical protein